MKSTYLTSVAKIGRWVATVMFCLSVTVVFVGGFLSHNPAIAATPDQNLIASVGSEAKQKANEDAENTKGFIRDVKDKVKDAAKSNASKVEDATDGSGNFLERKAKNDAATIQKRANEDAARTQNAVDATKDAFKDAVDNIREAF
ncbi:hypothetical protein [Rivularia sp. UHCC 0363]|uniref:hypothetical protein n=1 Tax=Rivularia sp. UHCC 0363 TaxID=3110244 RepID=UPI002B20CDDE|nr:hypothetical protein [Rivularia sp. UHCC 0363]MEA5597240.1 hypothetical protein [Rivularia sp. UHCC 0363]